MCVVIMINVCSNNVKHTKLNAKQGSARVLFFDASIAEDHTSCIGAYATVLICVRTCFLTTEDHTSCIG
jgi:hypothetical protein